MLRFTDLRSNVVEYFERVAAISLAKRREDGLILCIHLLDLLLKLLVLLPQMLHVFVAHRCILGTICHNRASHHLLELALVAEGRVTFVVVLSIGVFLAGELLLLDLVFPLVDAFDEAALTDGARLGVCRGDTRFKIFGNSIRHYLIMILNRVEETWPLID